MAKSASKKEGDDGESSERLQCTVPARTLEYLERLARTGTHGSRKVSGVMTFIITQGVQDAIARGIIKPIED